MVGYSYNPATIVTKAYLSNTHTKQTNKLLLVYLIIHQGLFKCNNNLALFTLKPFLCVLEYYLTLNLKNTL